MEQSQFVLFLAVSISNRQLIHQKTDEILTIRFLPALVKDFIRFALYIRLCPSKEN
jgi:hypothetical protein